MLEANFLTLTKHWQKLDSQESELKKAKQHEQKHFNKVFSELIISKIFNFIRTSMVKGYKDRHQPYITPRKFSMNTYHAL